MRTSSVVLPIVLAGLGFLAPAADASVSTAVIEDEVGEPGLPALWDIAGVTVRYDATTGRIDTAVRYATPATPGGRGSIRVDLSCTAADGGSVRVLVSPSTSTYAVVRDPELTAQSSYGPAERTTETPTEGLTVIADRGLSGLRCLDARARYSRGASVDGELPSPETTEAAPFVSGSAPPLAEPSRPDRAPSSSFSAEITDEIGEQGTTPGDDIAAATIRYDDQTGRFDAAVTFAGWGPEEPPSQWVAANCTDRGGQSVQVRVFTSGGAQVEVGPAASERSDSDVLIAPQWVSRSSTTRAATVVDARLVGLTCRDAEVRMLGRYRYIWPSSFTEPPRDETEAFPFVAAQRGGDEGSATVAPGDARPVPDGAPTNATPRPPSGRPRCRLIDRTAPRGRAFRVDCTATDRIVRVRYRRGSQTLLKRFTVRGRIVRAGTRGLTSGNWRVSVLDSSGKVGSGSVRVRSR